MTEISSIQYFSAGNYTTFYSFVSWYISLARCWQMNIVTVARNTQHLTADNILNTELKHVNDWLKLNNLQLMIDETTIERVAEFNLLGLTLDEKPKLEKQYK